MRDITSFHGSPIVSQLTIQISKTNVLFPRIWLSGVLACGLGLTAAWGSLLGYIAICLIIQAI